MTIRSDIKDALASGPKTADELASITGHSIKSIENALGYLHADGAVRKVDGGFALPLVKALPQQISRLASPPYVPPKVMHRREIDAPGCVVRRLLTGEVMQ
jgi:hypothetical protein